MNRDKVATFAVEMVPLTVNSSKALGLSLETDIVVLILLFRVAVKLNDWSSKNQV